MPSSSPTKLDLPTKSLPAPNIQVKSPAKNPGKITKLFNSKLPEIKENAVEETPRLIE